jgi:hypothetical protein
MAFFVVGRGSVKHDPPTDGMGKVGKPEGLRPRENPRIIADSARFPVFWLGKRRGSAASAGFETLLKNLVFLDPGARGAGQLRNAFSSIARFAQRDSFDQATITNELTR